MATPAPKPTAYQKLSPAAQRLALAKWHARQDAAKPLTAVQQRKAALAQVVAPGLTQGDLNRMVGADTGMRYGQSETDLRQQPAKINAAFAAYKNAIAQGGSQLTGTGDQLGGLYGGAVQGVSNLQKGLDTASQQQWAGQQAAMQADAANRGATVDPALADQAHNASNIRNILTGSFGAQLVAQGQNTRQQYTDRGVTAAQQQGETVGAARQKLADLLKEKGQFKVSDAQNIISSTTSNALKNALTQGQLGNYKSERAARKVQGQVSKQNANTSATRVTQSHSQWAQSSNKYGVTNGEWANWSDARRQDWIKKVQKSSKTSGAGSKTKPASGPGSLTSATEQKRLERVRRIAQYYKVGVTVTNSDGSKTVIAQPGQAAKVTTWLQQQGVDPLAISVGQNLYTNQGKLDRSGVNAAHRYGIHVGGNFSIAPPASRPRPKPDVGGVPGVNSNIPGVGG